MPVYTLEFENNLAEKDLSWQFSFCMTRGQLDQWGCTRCGYSLDLMCVSLLK